MPVINQIIRPPACAFAACITIFALSPQARADTPAAETAVISATTAEDHVWLTLEDYREVPVAPSKPWNDLLQHLRMGFTLEPIMNRRVEGELNWYLKHPDYLTRVLNRGQRYLPHIVAEIEERGLPLELALLPIVESAYDPFAYSHGRAAGLWQIIPGTGRRFGIRQNWWYDGRRDIVDSTRGALEYLTYLHDMMDGDWLLAVASYNSGEGNVLRAVRRNRNRNEATDFWNLKLSRETSAYVPRLMALVEIVRDPAKYGVELPTIVNDVQFEVVDIDSQLDLAVAAELGGIDLDTLYAFNAGLNRWSTDPAGPHRLIVPADSAPAFQEALARVPARERVRWKRHEVRPGQTISEIAESYGTTLAAVRAANNLRGTLIRAGSFLMIPVATAPSSAYVDSADERRQRIQNRQRAGNRIEHVVAPGESFWSIGQRLVVWTDSAPAARDSGGLTRKVTYRVRRGDSLSRIATRFRVSVSDLVRWNGIDADNILRPGQTLTMYVDVTRQSS